MDCPCRSAKTYEQCCQPLIAGTAKAKTAEALMRARYSSYAKGETAFLVSSHLPARRGEFDEKAAQEWSKKSEWKGLEVMATQAGLESDSVGRVRFIATYAVEGKTHEHHEVAEFKKEPDGHWYFVDGGSPKSDPVERAAPKVGRNDPCPCGSGKKHKKCCAAKAL
ncbi:MAG: YchJ family metal-binding protein [Elusimicrobiota bacterium]